VDSSQSTAARVCTETAGHTSREHTLRLMASVAHDVRSAVASILYSTDFLAVHGPALKREILRETVDEIIEAIQRLQLTADSLLDYAKLGPAILVPVSLHEVFRRAQGVLRSLFHRGGHQLRVELQETWVRGNPVVMEQLFVNLLHSFVVAASRPCVVSVRALAQEATCGSAALVQVEITRQACSPDHSGDPGLESLDGEELADVLAAALGQGGSLSRWDGASGPGFAVRLPRSEGPR
jgi:signal transduction histidine kinase